MMAEVHFHGTAIVPDETYPYLVIEHVERAITEEQIARPEAPMAGWGITLVRADDADAKALDEIQEMLRDPRWGVGMLEDIRDIIERTGRSCKNYSDDRPTWGRH